LPKIPEIKNIKASNKIVRHEKTGRTTSKHVKISIDGIILSVCLNEDNSIYGVVTIGHEDGRSGEDIEKFLLNKHYDLSYYSGLAQMNIKKLIKENKIIFND
jgi:hypothetical protein